MILSMFCFYSVLTVLIYVCMFSIYVCSYFVNAQLISQMFTELQQMRQQLPDMEFGRRMAVERELEKVDAVRLINIVFDETGHFVLYGTMLGIKVINVETNR